MNERKKGAVATRVLGSFSEVTADIKERKKKRKKEERKKKRNEKWAVYQRLRQILTPLGRFLDALHCNIKRY